MAFVLSRDDVRGLAHADQAGQARAYIDRIRDVTASSRGQSRLGTVTPRVREGARLPWGWWDDGQWWFTVCGEDFHVSTVQFMAYVHQRANAQGVRAIVRRTQSCVVFRFTDVPAVTTGAEGSRLRVIDLL
jgi:hypothetical protein